MPHSLFLLAFAALIGCAVPESAMVPVAASIVYDTTDTKYFAERDDRAFHVERFSGSLRFLNEPSLRSARLPPQAAVLRFYWRRSFHPLVVVRLTIVGSTCDAVTKSVGEAEIEWSDPDSSGLSTPRFIRSPPVLRRDSTLAPVGDCGDVIRLFEAAERWATNAGLGDVSVDGSDWMFEVLDAAGHRAFARFSPDSSSAAPVWRAGVGALRLGRALPASSRERY